MVAGCKALEGKVALVTGAAGGIGAEIVRLFRDEGAAVVATNIMAPSDGDAALALDVSDESAWEAVVAQTGERFGRLDILVNGAGVFRPAAIADESAASFLHHVQINQLGVFLGMRAVQPVMTATGGGSIVNISSAAGLIGTRDTISYTGTKWAVRGMTKTAALEFAPFGIRVNSIHPGSVMTPMVTTLPGSENAGKASPMGRIGSVEEVARMALFVASDASSYSTGAEFTCDGGLTAA